MMCLSHFQRHPLHVASRTYAITQIRDYIIFSYAKLSILVLAYPSCTDLEITPYWICQKSKPETKRTPAAWFFSAFVTFVCVVCPLTSFASDVGFYMTCSDHYNHTAEILEEVKSKYSSQPVARYIDDEIPMNHIGIDKNSLKSGTSLKNMPDTPIERPAPLLARHKRHPVQGIQKLSVQELKVERHHKTKDKRALYHKLRGAHDHQLKKKRNKHLNLLKHTTIASVSTGKPENLAGIRLAIFQMWFIQTLLVFLLYNNIVICYWLL